MVSQPAVKPDGPLAGLFERARLGQLTLAELFQAAELLNGAGQRPAAAELYKCWLAFNAGDANAHLAWFNYSVTLRASDDTAGAMNALRASLALSPQFGPAHINLGRALEDCGQPVRAVEQWRKFAEATADWTADKAGHRLMILHHIGRVLESLDQLEPAEDVLWQAMQLRPDRTEAGQHWLSIRQRQCKWPVFRDLEHISRRQLVESLSPMALNCHADDPLFQLAKAARYNRNFIGRLDLAGFKRNPPRRKIGASKRLKVGFVSSDLRDHAVGFALSELFELLDAKTLELYGYYCGEPRPGDSTQARIRENLAHWRDISALSDRAAAEKIVSDGIDILIDVNGYTKHARTKIFAYRPAPAIVNFCGYPGTMGSAYHHYLIADPVIVPPEHEIYYSEKILRIPCNQPVDRKRAVAATPNREAAGLPEQKFVFASFNGMQKITANGFARWMKILAAIPDSVLWLLSGHEGAETRLRAAASAAGVDAARLIFAPKVANPHHLARIKCADLFLDTLPYGAHSTAADALTMGLPVLTLAGRGFAARFCASVVAAAGLPELVVADEQAYVDRAVAIGSDPALARALKQKLLDSRDVCALRDMPGLARRLEEIFWEIQRDVEADAVPTPDLTNLDLYYEIGQDLDLANIERLDADAYRQLYRDKLALWDEVSPLPHDSRLWPAPAADRQRRAG